MDTLSRFSSGSSLSTTFELLSYFSLEGDRYIQSGSAQSGSALLSKGQILTQWLRHHSEQWVRLALVESLYQGRYKMICVEQLLELWNRRGQPTLHFNHEFASLVCHDVPHQTDAIAAVATELVPHEPVLPMLSPTSENIEGFAAAQRMVVQSVSEQVSALEIFSETAASEAVISEDSAEAGLLSAEVDYWLESDLESALEPEIEQKLTTNRRRTAIQDRPSVLSSVSAMHNLLPLTLHRLGQEPIHQFMPQATPAEFCERLEAIAHSSI